ncbi:hypothetical protein CANCADRAFT_25602 [Tortispora caseinolytica NRRL Y-17796]|uniref:Mitochondrial carrier protein n=1 Tax=Tortispora caseinolytica NRRL Y-17796 TaxID=767744 RepID=A0A1E4TGY2_9ASCO|nr:hypothetical protein CANCADRAFT_25602 [Tortispora caseinolytica NRRL Y-17796]
MSSDERSTQVSAASASARAFSNILALYLRVPAKLFRPTRLDYLAVPRLLSPAISRPWSFTTHSGFGLISNAVRLHGWQFLIQQVLPPFIANSAIGLVLYTSYLIALPSSQDNTFSTYFKAGAFAGFAQALAASPFDAVASRYSVAEALHGKMPLWTYARMKLKEIGLSGVFAGFTLSAAKESLAFGAYFSVFESLKSAPLFPYKDSSHTSQAFHKNLTILIAGVCAAVSLQTIHYPFSRIQDIHTKSLELIDFDAASATAKTRPLSTIHLYRHAYSHTLKSIWKLGHNSIRGTSKWLYKGFARSIFTSIPGSSIGIIVFEIFREAADVDSAKANTNLAPF